MRHAEPSSVGADAVCFRADFGRPAEFRLQSRPLSLDLLLGFAAAKDFAVAAEEARKGPAQEPGESAQEGKRGIGLSESLPPVEQ